MISRLFALCLATFLTVSSGVTLAQESGGVEYRIGPEDILHISVWQEDDLYKTK